MLLAPEDYVTSFFSNTEDYYEIYLGSNEYHSIHPCKDLEHFPSCTQYCSWHKRFFESIDRKEFLTVMKYGSPQRKIILDAVETYEKNLAIKLFGEEFVKDLDYFNAPIPMAIFCHRKDKGFLGDNIGMHANVCNDFFPTPTDAGICLSRNLDIKEIMHPNDQFETMSESNLQQKTENIEGGFLWSETTLVIFTDAENTLKETYRKRSTKTVGEVQFQLHQPKEFGQMYKGGIKY